ncbi:DnaJ-domain-containing protein [Aaosphaeria arxii CBS 175.79]|uniref:DnaJ-domain-containing protein n=1 Tax=Aaosphaeria arxii CBS 175.79 TaxID=1450172 RepID=A0A6A5XE96_9PLEO|nr:DnaJ-domain-containing protein [Aaosphaeria arxii CBS 175.79]KAF2011213.1 DnaJ-domain-containing protein [Aaosphaeria arxii CBS 175.79]
MSDSNKDLEDVAKTTNEDFYELLGVGFDCVESEIKRAYRKTSIKYHPDKNKDDQNAADRFILIGIARDILLDAKLKGEYDRARMRRKEKALQDELLDGKRRKMKEDLERRERAGVSMKRKRAEDLSEAERRELEIQRLAEDGKRRRKEQQEKMERQRQEEEASFMEPSPEVETKPAPTAPGQTAEIDRTVKVRFVRDGDAATWDKEHFSQVFSKYGKIDSVVMGKEKKLKLPGEKHRKVVVMVFIVYTRLDHAHAAVMDAKADIPSLESVGWAGKEPDIKSPNLPAEPTPSAPSTPVATPNKTFRASFNPNLGKGFGSAPGTPSFSFSPKTPSLEEVTMMRLKQAEKRRLEEQIRQQEAAEEAAA